MKINAPIYYNEEWRVKSNWELRELYTKMNMKRLQKRGQFLSKDNILEWFGMQKTPSQAKAERWWDQREG